MRAEQAPSHSRFLTQRKKQRRARGGRLSLVRFLPAAFARRSFSLSRAHGPRRWWKRRWRQPGAEPRRWNNAFFIFFVFSGSAARSSCGLVRTYDSETGEKEKAIPSRRRREEPRVGTRVNAARAKTDEKGEAIRFALDSSPAASVTSPRRERKKKLSPSRYPNPSETTNTADLAPHARPLLLQ